MSVDDVFRALYLWEWWLLQGKESCLGGTWMGRQKNSVFSSKIEVMTYLWKFTGFKSSELLFCWSNSAKHTTPMLITYHFICSWFYNLGCFSGWLFGYPWGFSSGVSWGLGSANILVAGLFSLSLLYVVSPNGVSFRAGRLHMAELGSQQRKSRSCRFLKVLAHNWCRVIYAHFKASHRPSWDSCWGNYRRLWIQGSMGHRAPLCSWLP